MVKKGLPLLGLFFMIMKELFLVRSDRVREKTPLTFFFKKIAEFPRLTSTTERSLLKI